MRTGRGIIRSGWHGNYVGSVTAEKGATLSGLAYVVTRYAKDWTALNTVDRVAPGQVVDIAPLLAKFEMRIRAATISATRKFKAKGFPSSLTVPAATKRASESTNKYFSSHAMEFADCTVAAMEVQKKATIDALSNNLFNVLSDLNEFQEIPMIEKELPANDAWVGDKLRFPNYEDWSSYHSGESEWPWGGENVIKIGNDQYWGYIGSSEYTVKSIQEWSNLLQIEFNKLNGPKRNGMIPEINKPVQVNFPDIAHLAMNFFDTRRRRR